MTGSKPALDRASQLTARVPGPGALIMNADDWGCNSATTDRTLECIRCGAVSSVSAMVFMEDSERAAEIAMNHQIDAGLHLNFTHPFSRPSGLPGLVEHQQRVMKYLCIHRLSQVLFHPGLTRSFEYLVAAQCDEFSRLYGAAPRRLDGHHHMHLCANVVFGRLLPSGTVVRRNFSFRPGEKSGVNRMYRQIVDGALNKRHFMTDYFGSLSPLRDVRRLRWFGSLVEYQHVVELETHPINPDEFRVLTEDGVSGIFGYQIPIPVGFPCLGRLAM